MRRATAVAYFRTSSAANVGQDKDSEHRQRDAVTAYAKAKHMTVAAEFYDAAVSGADPVDERDGFKALLTHCEKHDISIVLVENASRFARDLTVQLTGHALLQGKGIELIPVDAPTHFTDPTPTAEMVRHPGRGVAVREGITRWEAARCPRAQEGRDRALRGPSGGS